MAARWFKALVIVTELPTNEHEPVTQLIELPVTIGPIASDTTPAEISKLILERVQRDTTNALVPALTPKNGSGKHG